MRVVTAMELRARLGEILDNASGGERITIERDRRPIAVLVSPEDAARLDESAEERVQRGRAALDRLERLAARIAAGHPADPDQPDAAEDLRAERESGHGEHG